MKTKEHLEDIRIAVAKLSDENKKYVIAVAQALLFTQKEEKGGHKNIHDVACFNQR